MNRIVPATITVAFGLLTGCNSSPSATPASTTVATTSGPSQDAPATAQPSSTARPATASAAAAADVDPASVPRISAQDAHAKVAAGKALLVCSYGDRSKCGGLGIASGMAWADFAERLPDLAKDQEIILYCA